MLWWPWLPGCAAATNSTLQRPAGLTQCTCAEMVGPKALGMRGEMKKRTAVPELQNAALTWSSTSPECCKEHQQTNPALLRQKSHPISVRVPLLLAPRAPSSARAVASPCCGGGDGRFIAVPSHPCSPRLCSSSCLNCQIFYLFKGASV